jgi:hypothetical protein
VLNPLSLKTLVHLYSYTYEKKVYTKYLTFCPQVQRLEKERLESDESLSKCKSVVNSQNETISGLKNQLANMEDLKNQLHV